MVLSILAPFCTLKDPQVGMPEPPVETEDSCGDQESNGDEGFGDRSVRAFDQGIHDDQSTEDQDGIGTPSGIETV
ncbi:hypothetical protein [Roseovarius atlanticus]|uniref:hypothetical protein n=1 Tax=Roseovarius atlanticus TaxID=1641875 RepID=UPI001187554C|nr:hypothetical protein [Roseovarius atlanticus]